MYSFLRVQSTVSFHHHPHLHPDIKIQGDQGHEKINLLGYPAFAFFKLLDVGHFLKPCGGGWPPALSLSSLGYSSYSPPRHLNGWKLVAGSCSFRPRYVDSSDSNHFSQLCQAACIRSRFRPCSWGYAGKPACAQPVRPTGWSISQFRLTTNTGTPLWCSPPASTARLPVRAGELVAVGGWSKFSFQTCSPRTKLGQT